ncbi:MAG TPA: lycopene cyclase domain-containing protein [Actinophytocola sp.]|uniref:lycopene cyclase domain-containing protein n=1 Tax=Actinophytocola sp. TaxID=1872138 RepID=UPI002DB6AEEA|nr:lycopene cyclase domain-containing protein [Actinophytocola sp.]HEU5473313.1 lycopene cyclase domain-containing protein [Actinophytocola sp.]
MLGEYTAAALLASVAVVLLETTLLRTGLFRRGRYWAAMAIVLAFQVLVDGWLTKAAAPIVHYSAEATSGVRVPWDIPVEDFGFGFALATLTLLLWERHRRDGEHA